MCALWELHISTYNSVFQHTTLYFKYTSPYFRLFIIWCYFGTTLILSWSKTSEFYPSIQHNIIISCPHRKLNHIQLSQSKLNFIFLSRKSVCTHQINCIYSTSLTEKVEPKSGGPFEKWLLFYQKKIWVWPRMPCHTRLWRRVLCMAQPVWVRLSHFECGPASLS